MNDNRFDDEYEYDDDADVGIGPTRAKVVLGLLIAAAVAVLAVLWFFVVPAHAHTHDGIAYPPNCCNSAATSPTGDCSPIDDRYVTEEPDGYHINLPIGAHPRLKTKGYVGIVPYVGVKQPLDNHYHICLSNDGGSRYCFFPKPGSV